MKKIIASIIGGLAFIIVLIVAFGLFPVGRVGSDRIWYRELRRDVKTAEHFRKTITQDPNLGALAEGGPDTRRIVLEDMIGKQIIHDALYDLKKEGVEEAVRAQVNEAVSKVEDQEKLRQAARTIYDMPYEEFEKRILVPKAEETVLQKEIQALGKNFNEWLLEKRKTATVRIYFLPYEWRDGKLERT